MRALIAAIIIAVLAAAAYLFFQQGAEEPTVVSPPPVTTQAAPESVIEEPEVSLVEEDPVTEEPAVSEPVSAAKAPVVSKRDFQEGVHYVLLASPVRTRNPNKIEVTEVFWYGCGHCYSFEALVHPWQETLGDDVDFQGSPAMWNAVMQVHARAFYTAKALGVLGKMHSKIFSAMHVAKNPLRDEQSIAKLFAQNGVPLENFSRTFNSFGVTSQVKQADSRARGYQVTGTPEMVVDGKYRISAKMTGGQAGMLEVASFLVDKIRSEKK